MAVSEDLLYICDAGHKKVIIASIKQHTGNISGECVTSIDLAVDLLPFAILPVRQNIFLVDYVHGIYHYNMDNNSMLLYINFT